MLIRKGDFELKKKILSLLLSIAILIGLFPVTMTTYAATSGKCGTNLTWALNSHTLTISGTGEMNNYTQSSPAPWDNEKSKIYSIIIEDKVTSVGDRAFVGCEFVASVTLPSSVTSIGNSSFAFCRALTHISIPDGVIKIGNNAFDYCQKLSWISIPDSVIYLGTEAFSYCIRLTSAVIGKGLTSIASKTFNQCSKLSELTISDNVANISSDALDRCYNLTNIKVSENNKVFSSLNGDLYNKDQSCLLRYASGKTNSEFIIPDSVNSIGVKAFYNSCYYLKSVVIPSNITYIGATAFYGCSELQTIYYNGTQDAWNIINGSSNLSSLSKRYFSYVVILNTNGDQVSKSRVDIDKPLNINVIPSKKGFGVRLYTDANCNVPFDYLNTVITENTVLYYQYVINQYTNKFVNDDGTVIQESTVDYGTTISAPDVIPSKPADDQYTYTFAGWDGFSEGMTQQAEEMIFTAKYTTSVNQYSYHFVDEDGTILKEGTVDYGAEIIPPENPTKNNTPQYSHTFTGWDGYTAGMTQSAEELYFYATYSVSVNQYTYRFVDEDGTVLKKKTINYNALITAPTSPKKAATAQYTYTFEKWEGYTPGMKITGDVTFTAVYTATLNQYTYKFVDENGIVIDEKTVDYGTEIVAPNITLTKEATEQYTYTHTGWNHYTIGMTISEDITFTPIFTTEINQYSYQFIDEDGTVLKEATVDYGSEIIAPENPSKDATQEYTYTFAYWDGYTDGMKQKAETMIFKAVYSAAINQYTYKFIDEDGKELKSETVNYGTEIIPPENPSKASTDKYSYIFKGWNDYKNGMIITDNITFTAEYTAEINKYTFKFIDYDGTVIKEATVAYGTTIPLPTAPSEHSDQQYTYTFLSWSGYIKGMTITKDIIFTARYSKILNQYTYLFVDENGEAIFEDCADYGTVIHAPEAPQKASTDKYSYIFSGWKDYTDGMILTEDIIFTPIYTPVINQYTYKFVDDDGAVLYENTVDYDTVIPVPNDPAKESTKQYAYVFAGWEGYTEGIKQKAETMIFRAKYRAIVNQYTYTFLNEDGTIIDKSTVDYGAKIILPENPSKEATKQYSYIFNGWDGYTGGMTITEDISFTATYTRVINQYTYRFVDNDNIIVEKTVDYGTEIVLPDTPDDKDPYTFDYWDGYTAGMTIADDITFTAVYRYKKYVITINESSKTKEVIYGDNYTLPIQEIKDFVFKGYYTKPNGDGIKLTDEQGNSVNVYSFAENITAYPYYVHSFANKAIINGVDTVQPGDKNVTQVVQFATDKQAKNLKCTIKYPKDFVLADITEKDFSLANIDKTETIGEYTYSYLTCMYDYSGTLMPTNQTITPLELKFDIGKNILQGEVSVEISDIILIGESTYNIDAVSVKSIRGVPKLAEKIKIVGSNKIDASTKYTAIVTHDYATNKEVSWSVDNEAIAMIAEDGTLIPLKNGTVIITALAKDGSEVFASYEVEVISYAKIDSIKLMGTWDKEFSPDIHDYTIYVKDNVQSVKLTTKYKNGTLFMDNVLLLPNTEQQIDLTDDVTIVTLKRNNVSDLTSSEYKITIVKFEGTKTIVPEDGNSFTIKPVNIAIGSTVVLALYDNGKFIEMQSEKYNGTNISFTTDKPYTNAKVMVWDSLENMKPVCNVEIIK